MRRRRSSARLVTHLLACAVLAAASSGAGAQAPVRTTIGALLGGRVDTVEVSHRSGGRLGNRGAHLLVVRAGGEFADGTLRHTRANRGMPIVGGEPEVMDCARTFRVSLPVALLDRLLAAIDTTVVDSGRAAPRPRTATDHYSASTMRFAGARGSVTVDDARTVTAQGSPWHVPQRGAWRGQGMLRFPPHDRTTLVVAWEALAPYLLPERERAFTEACTR